MAELAWGAIGAGTVLAGRPLAIAGRPVGAAMICFGALCLAARGHCTKVMFTYARIERTVNGVSANAEKG